MTSSDREEVRHRTCESLRVIGRTEEIEEIVAAIRSSS